MAPVVPTYRPVVTPERAAIAVAIAAVACSIFLALDAAWAQPLPADAHAACVERVADARRGELWDELELNPVHLQ